MKTSDPNTQIETIAEARFDRRKFVRQASLFGLGAAASSIVLATAPAAHAQQESWQEQQQDSAQSMDTVKEIFTAALIAEDLATTFYYNALVGTVIQDPNLAGSGGSATNVTASGNLGNVEYVRAALSEEISHANLFRSLLDIPEAAKDPVQTFYFPAGTFNTLAAFTGLLNALENAFIGAYLNAIQEFAAKAARVRSRRNEHSGSNGDSGKYSAEQLEYYAKVAASIMGIECEHRVLGRVISNTNPANNLCYEQTDGLNAVYNGPKSAVAALTPFLTPSTGMGYSLAEALDKQSSVSLPCTGAPPAY